MECTDINERLQAYLEGTLGNEEQAVVEEHLVRCQRCSTSLDEIRKTVELLKGLDEVEPPPWMTRKVMTMVRAESPPKRGFLDKLFRPFSVKLPIEALAVVLLGVATYYVFKTVEPEVRPVVPPQETKAVEKLSPLQQAEVKEREAPSGRQLKKEAAVPSPQGEGQGRALSPLKDTPQSDVPLEKRPAPAQRQAEAPGLELRQVPAPAASSGKAAEQDAEATAEREGTPAKARHEGLRAQAASPATARTETLRVTVTVRDLDTAFQEATAAVRKLEGRIVRAEALSNGSLVVVSIDGARLREFLEGLRSLGEVREGSSAVGSAGQEQEVRVEMVKQPGP